MLAILGVGLVDPELPVVRADDPGITRGDGCFEGCRVRTSADGVSRVDKIERHLARMARSAATLEIPFDAAAWRDQVDEVLAAWREPGEVGMKLLLTRGPSETGPLGLISIYPVPEDFHRQRRDGLKIVTLSHGTASDGFLEAPWLLGGVKTLSYAVNMAAQREAVRRGADDVIFVSTDGRVLESPTSSVVWSTGRTLFTTPLGPNGILAGTTQELLFERATAAGWTTSFVEASVEDLHAAEVLWLIGSVRGPVDVIDLDGKQRQRKPEIDAEIRRLSGFGA